MLTSHRAPFLSSVLIVALSLACASSPPGTTTTTGARPSDSDVITQEELADPSVAGSTLLEAVRRLRPRFLNTRSGDLRGHPEGVQVSVNGGEFVPVSELSRMAVAEVSEVRYLSVADASLRFGLQGSLRPVLLITLRAR